MGLIREGFVQTACTITYSEGSQGFPSFYSYCPDFIIGMNQFLYTFNGGNLYRHNTNPIRNEYYGVVYPSRMTSIFNEAPLQNKIFKTINLESDDAWRTTLRSDIQTTGVIEAEYFVEKEGAWFAFVRNDGPVGANTNESEWELRSLNGIANSIAVGGVAAAYNIDFALSVNIGSILSVGDLLYYAEPPIAPVTQYTPVFAGQVTEILIDKPAGINRLVINSVVDQQGNPFNPPATNPIPIADAYFFFIKNPIAESHGILGHYGEFTVELPTTITTKSELFAVEADIMKSFP